MKEQKLFNMTIVFTFTLMSLCFVSFGQTAQNDTIYLFDGNRIATSIFDGWEDSERIRHRISNRDPVVSIAKSDVFYLYASGEYHQINVYDRHQQLRYNIQAFQREAQTGMMILGSGVGVVLLSKFMAEQQAKRYRESLNPDDISDFPAYLNYGGYAIMLTGSLITVSSFRFLDRGSVDITPVGVRINL